MKGRASNEHHRRLEDPVDKEREVPRVSMDYFYMSKDDEKASNYPFMMNKLVKNMPEPQDEKASEMVGKWSG